MLKIIVMKQGRPKILYVFNKQPNYSRIKILRMALLDHAELVCLCSERSSYLGRTLEVLWKFLWHSRQSYDVLVVGFFAQLLMPLLRPFWRGPIVADCYISLFDSYVNDRGLASAKSIRARICSWADRYLLKQAELVLTDTEQHRKYLQDQYGVEAARIHAVPISADESLFPKLPPATSPRNGGRFEILFFGAFIPLQGVETIISAVHRLDPGKFRVRLIGHGQTFEACQVLANDLEVENLDFLGWKKVEEISKEAERAHLILGIFGQTEKAKRVIPNKVFEALSLGRPLVTGDSIAVREYFTEGKDIFLVPFADPEALTDKIEWLSQNYGQALKVAEVGHQLFVEQLSPKAVSVIVGETIKEYI